MSDHLIDEIARDLNEQQRRKELGLPPVKERSSHKNLFFVCLEEILTVLAICAVPTLMIRYFFG